MNTGFELSLVGLVTLFALGLRHGLDPDHIAAIDGMTLRAHDQGHAHARWIGGLFSLGHGVVVIVIAMLTAALSSEIKPPESLLAVAQWIPLLFLIWVAIVNLIALLKPADYQPVSVRGRWLPKRWQGRCDPLAAAVVGVFFATVFDTVTLAATWGFAASTQGGIWVGLVAGLAFTSGMVLCDTADSWLIVYLSRKADASGIEQNKQRYRRALGWLVVGLSFVVVGWSLVNMLGLELAYEDALRTGLGAIVLLVSVAIGFWLLRIAHQSISATHVPINPITINTADRRTPSVSDVQVGKA